MPAPMPNEQRIRILQVLEATYGGTRKHLRYIVDRLDTRRFDVSVACSTLRNPAFEADIAALERRGLPVHVIQMERSVSPLRDMRAVARLYALMKRGRFDIVHAHSSKAGFLGRAAARCAGVPCIVYSPHAFYFYKGIKGTSAFYLMVERMAAKITDTIVAVSRGEESIARDFKVCNARKLVTIENGVDPAEFNVKVDVRAKMSELGIREGSNVVGMVGRVCEQKGYEYFLRAAHDVIEHFPRAVFVLVGQGVEDAKARRLVSDLKISENVILAGHRNDVAELCALFDVLILPSIWEGMPYVLLEAMAMGVPVIASDIPGVREVVIDNETGLLFPAGDVAVLSRKIVSILSDKERGKIMSEAGRRRVKNRYRVDDKIEALARLYEELADGSARRRCIERRQAGV